MDNDDDNDRLRRLSVLWSELDEAVISSGFDDMLVDPWESQKPKIIAAWERLTRPENLPDLEFWLARFDNGRGMNDWAKKVTIKAIEVCRAKGIK